MKSVKTILREMDPNLKPDDDAYPAAAALVAAATVGTSADKIARRARIPRSKARAIAARCREAGLFAAGKISHGGWFGKDGGIAFWLDVAVAQGYMERR
jgi:hypothetical protein